jgi:hypothetical protein
MLFKMTKVGATCDPKNQRSQASSCSTSSSTARATSRTSRSVLDDKVYDHVLRLLGFDQLMFPDHPVIEALQHGGYTDFPSLFMLRRADVESPTYFDTDVQPPIRKPLPLGIQTRLLVPQGYRNYVETTNKRSLEPSDWMCITVDDIKTYMMSSEFMFFFNNSLVSTKLPGPSLTSQSKSEVALDSLISSNEPIHPNHLDGSTIAPALSPGVLNQKYAKDDASKKLVKHDIFIPSNKSIHHNHLDGTTIAPALSPGVPKRKSAKELSQKPIKRDLNCFKTFSDKRYWTTWYQHFVATARAQDLQDLLDPNYIPSTPSDKDVFKARQEYLYSVFVHILQTKEGKALVQSKSLSNNAQSIFTSLCAHYSNVRKTNHQQQCVVQTDSVLQLFESQQLCTTNPADPPDSTCCVADPIFALHNLKDERTQAHPVKDAYIKTPQFNMTSTHRTILCLTDLFDGETPSKLFVPFKNNSEISVCFKNLQICNSESGAIEQFNTPPMVYLKTLDPIGRTILTTVGIVVLEITRELSSTGNCALLFTARDITVVTTTERAPFTHAIHLSDLRNSMTSVGIKHCDRMAMTIKECQYIYFKSIQVSFDNDTYHKDTKTFGETIHYLTKDKYKSINNHHDPHSTTDNSMHESTYTSQTKQKNGETAFSIAQTDDFGNLDKVGPQQQQSFIGLLHSAASLGRLLITAVATMVFVLWLTSPDHLLDQANWINCSLLRLKPVRIWFPSLKPDLAAQDARANTEGRHQTIPSPLVSCRHVLHRYHLVALYIAAITDPCCFYSNGPPIDWYHKRHSKVETASHGKEFTLPQPCTETLLADIRHTLICAAWREWIFRVDSRISNVNCTWQLHDVFCKEQNGLWVHEPEKGIPSCVFVSTPISGENMFVKTSLGNTTLSRKCYDHSC